MKTILLFLMLQSVGMEVRLTWDASTFPPSGGGYNIYRGEQSGVLTKLNSAVLTTNSYTDATGVAGKTYFWAVTAVAGTVESGKSNEVTATVKPLVVVPVAPTALTALCKNGGTTADLSWTIPSNANGSYLRAHVEGTVLSGPASYLVYLDNIPDTTRSLSIPPGRKIIWSVNASNSAGLSPTANSSFTCILPAPTGLKVAFLLPTEASIKKGPPVPITVEAFDSVRLDLLINNTQVATSATGLLGFNWHPKKKMRYLLMGRATDVAGNRVQATKTVDIR